MSDNTPTDRFEPLPSDSLFGEFAQSSPSQSDTSMSQPAQSAARLPVRTSTIVWGGILLLVAAIAAATVLVDAPVYTPRVILWTIVGFGGLLVLAGVIGAVARVTTSRNSSDGNEL